MTYTRVRNFNMRVTNVTHISFTKLFLEKSFVITIVTRLGKRYLENNPLIIKVTKQSFYLLFKLQQYKKYSFSIKKINK